MIKENSGSLLLTDKKRKKPIQFRATLIVFTVIFSIYSFTLLFPFIWLVFNSLKTKAGFLFYPMSFSLPLKFSNYIEIFTYEDFNLPVMFFNSIVLVVSQVSVSLFVSCCVAYVVAKFKFVGRNFIYFLAILIMFIPTTGSLVTLYTFMNDTKLMDTYHGMIILSAGGFGFTFLVLYGFFKNISDSYAEAAAIDGAGYFKTFIRIMMPQAAPVLIALSVINGIGVWNDFFTQLVFFAGHPTVAVGIKSLSDNIVEYTKEYPLFFSAIIITTLPVIILYGAFQKLIVTNTATGGLKG